MFIIIFIVNNILQLHVPETLTFILENNITLNIKLKTDSSTSCRLCQWHYSQACHTNQSIKLLKQNQRAETKPHCARSRSSTGYGVGSTCSPHTNGLGRCTIKIAFITIRKWHWGGWVLMTWASTCCPSVMETNATCPTCAMWHFQ